MGLNEINLKWTFLTRELIFSGWVVLCWVRSSGCSGFWTPILVVMDLCHLSVLPCPIVFTPCHFGLAFHFTSLWARSYLLPPQLQTPVLVLRHHSPVSTHRETTGRVGAQAPLKFNFSLIGLYPYMPKQIYSGKKKKDLPKLIPQNFGLPIFKKKSQLSPLTKSRQAFKFK